MECMWWWGQTPCPRAMKCQNQSDLSIVDLLEDMPRDDEKNTCGVFHREFGSKMYDQMARDEERRDFALYCVARQTFVCQPSTLREGSGLSAGSIAQAYLQGALSNFRDAEDDFASLASTASATSTVSLSMPAVNDWRGAPTLRLLVLPLVWQQAQLFRGSESKAQSLGPSREVARGPGWACSAATLIARCRKPARQISRRTLATRIYATIVNWPWARASLPTYVAVSSELLVLFQSLCLILRLE